MRLDDYLVTRLVEQVVHLDDLARSLGVESWPVPDDHVKLVLETATADRAPPFRRHGDAAGAVPRRHHGAAGPLNRNPDAAT